MAAAGDDWWGSLVFQAVDLKWLLQKPGGDATEKASQPFETKLIGNTTFRVAIYRRRWCIWGSASVLFVQRLLLAIVVVKEGDGRNSKPMAQIVFGITHTRKTRSWCCLPACTPYLTDSKSDETSLIIPIGNGKMMVLFFSADIELSVCEKRERGKKD